MARLLLEKGYEVYGAYRRTASLNLWRLRELGIDEDIHLVPIELLEFNNVLRIINSIRPDEVYNLAAQSFVGLSFEEPIFTCEVDALGTARLLEAIRLIGPKSIRFYQASTSEMFGNTSEVPQRETTPLRPRSPYGIAKAAAHWLTVNYREAFGIHASSGILFNHESPLRGLEFVTRKITSGLAELYVGRRDCVLLGNLDAQRDWGYAADYVEGMWLMLQQPHGGDYVLATGVSHTVRDFATLAASELGYRLEWERATDGSEVARDVATGKTIFRTDPRLLRPADIDVLRGDASKARHELGWVPRISFGELVNLMVRRDVERAKYGPILF